MKLKSKVVHLGVAGLISSACLTINERALPEYPGVPTPDISGAGLDAGRDATSSDARAGDGPDRDQTSDDASRAGADVDPRDRGVDAPSCLPAAEETCNGVDDDCDGQTDEREGPGPESLALVESCYDGDVSTLNRGPCVRGARTCVDGDWGGCVGQVVPAPETCNGQDDDCDGSEDLDDGDLRLARACYGGDRVDLMMVGAACQQGVEVCGGGVWGQCSGEILPSSEDCDGLDDDCDGRVDEMAGDCGCAAGEVQDCGAQPALDGIGECRIGSQACDAAQGTFGSCNGEVRSTAETCNGLDDDCDGAVDDDIVGVLTVCAVQSGACVSEGRYQCRPEEGGIICDALRPVVGVEVCNALDDDCDGSTDEGLFLEEACAIGIGACRRPGRITCRGGGEGVMCDAVAGPPRPEECNAIDDDCDNRTDEGLEGIPLTRDCRTGAGGACDSGSQVCVEGAFGACMPPDGEEVCNAVDDDCDGRIDESIALCDPCQAGQSRNCWTGEPQQRRVGQCLDGRQGCRAPPLWDLCAGQVLPGREFCDGLDNDCDGSRDEDLEMRCTVGVGICLAEGLMRCRGLGGFGVCEAAGLSPEDESCNQLDDDCDGVTDEDLGVGLRCIEGVGDCRSSGLTVCDINGAVVCGRQVIAPTSERCDGRDNDCDGLIDEPDAPCIVEGLDVQCEAGHAFCVGGRAVCLSDHNQVETCNGLDDDCDGTIDESLLPLACER